ncbi:hypothetical protein PIB30_050982 [Stylosanthes scabra]|uniref:NB-ARC domain-containing protein n=1 Tax=Stylosanthes scabra TaxID=79078 RepID=A0ABU6RHY8_9FABA|nr:hypothetical protein [Stylosanthes scabra]
MGRGKKLLSSLPREMLSLLHNPNIQFRVKLSKLSLMRQSLLTLVAVADDAEAKHLPLAGSASCNVAEWLHHFHDVMHRLFKVLLDPANHDAEHALDLQFILQEFEIITKRKHLLLLTKKLQGEQDQEKPEGSSYLKANVYGREKEKNEMVDYLLSDRSSGSVGNTCVIAIVGVGGIGKTTLAEIVYHDERVKASFELRGWVDYQEGVDAVSLGKIALDSFDEDFLRSDGLTEVISRLRKCLFGKKFLLVLDGIQSPTCWKTLQTCFADAAVGSVVILTTSKLEAALEVRSDLVLHLGLLSPEDSCSLFLDHAFGDGNPNANLEFAPVTKQLVRKIGGLPIAVKKLASVLYDYPDLQAWKELLKFNRSHLLDLSELSLPIQFSERRLYNFRNMVRLEIVGVRRLKLPGEFAELRCLEYLDLSFCGLWRWPNSMSLLTRLHTLKLSFWNYVRPQSVFLYFPNLNYLDIRANSNPATGMLIDVGAMKNLQTLIGFTVNKDSGSNLEELASLPSIRTLSITELQNMVDATYALKANLIRKRHLENLTLRWNQLRVPELEQAPEYLQPTGQPKMLDICERALEYLEPPEQLKMLEILGCPVRRFPDWLGDLSFGMLEVLHLRDCRNCPFLPPLGQLSSLKELSIQGCDNVRSVGNEFYGQCTSYVPFKSLEVLWFVDMANWKEWILLDDERLHFPRLRELYLIHCPKLQQGLPKNLPSLKKIEIIHCDCLVAPLPKIPDNHESVIQEKEKEKDCADIIATSAGEHEEFDFVMDPIINRKVDEPVVDDDKDDRNDECMLDFGYSFDIVKVADASELCNLPDGLKSLRIEGCQFLESLPQFLNNYPDIFELFLVDCCSLKRFADVLHPKSLRTLHIRKCPVLEFIIPLGVHKDFKLLKHLFISSSCESLTSISINLFPRLQTLYIKDCPNLKSLSVATGLRDQNLKLESLKSLPNRFSTLTSLQSLLIDKCPLLESLPDGGLPSSLSLISIAFCYKLTPQKEWKLNTLSSLTCFEVEGGCIGMKSFPDKDLLPRNLKSLRISKLSSLRVLNGTGLQHLTALETLEINCCPGLISLPEGLPSSLTCLCIKESSILTHKLSYKAGTERVKVAHIPNLQIDEDAGHGVNKETIIPRKEVEAASLSFKQPQRKRGF